MSRILIIEDEENLANFVEMELKNLENIVVNLTSFFNSVDDCCKVIIGKNHVRGALCNVRTCNTHSDTDIGCQRSCIKYEKSNRSAAG